MSTSATVNLSRDAEYINKHLASNAERRATVGCLATVEDFVQVPKFAQVKAPYESQEKLDFGVKVKMDIDVGSYLEAVSLGSADNISQRSPPSSAPVVVAPANIVPTSETEIPDLMRALRGSGDGFGVVMKFVSRLREQRPVIYYAVMLSTPPGMETLLSEINTWLAN
ncbi:hypothetical protein FRC07_014609 [Ceratobasidium sp. 392]|nr:hypothetical protein FRC07_014609 [Ceratobasidium sp. 392]